MITEEPDLHRIGGLGYSGLISLTIAVKSAFRASHAALRERHNRSSDFVITRMKAAM
jgi:hypothetical protein